MQLHNNAGYKEVIRMLAQSQRKAFPFQEHTWQYIVDGQSGLVNAPTGCGKTFSVFLGAVIQFINNYPDNYTLQENNGLQ